MATTNVSISMNAHQEDSVELDLCKMIHGEDEVNAYYQFRLDVGGGESVTFYLNVNQYEHLRAQLRTMPSPANVRKWDTKTLAYVDGPTHSDARA